MSEFKSNKVTIEEMTMIRDYILLPHMEEMVQKSMADIEYSTNILKRAYLMSGRKILDEINNDIKRLRQELKKRNIKILDVEHADFIINHKYICRGYTEDFGMTRDVMKAEISIKLAEYVASLKSHLNNLNK